MARDGLEYATRSVTMYRPKDKELYDIIINVPQLKGMWPYVVLIFSVVLPGSGTMLASCAGYTTAWSKTQLLIGLL